MPPVACTIPWTESPFFISEFAQSNLSAADRELVHRLAEQGYLVIDPEIDPYLFELINRQLVSKFEKTQQKHAGNHTLNAKVFVSVGSLEAFMEMIPSMKKLTASLWAHNYQGLELEERVLPNESHGSAFLTSFNQGIRVLYKN